MESKAHLTHLRDVKEMRFQQEMCLLHPFNMTCCYEWGQIYRCTVFPDSYFILLFCRIMKISSSLKRPIQCSRFFDWRYPYKNSFSPKNFLYEMLHCFYVYRTRTLVLDCRIIRFLFIVMQCNSIFYRTMNPRLGRGRFMYWNTVVLPCLLWCNALPLVWSPHCQLLPNTRCPPALLFLGNFYPYKHTYAGYRCFLRTRWIIYMFYVVLLVVHVLHEKPDVQFITQWEWTHCMCAHEHLESFFQTYLTHLFVMFGKDQKELCFCVL